MTREAEIAQQTGTEAEFEAWVREFYPQCIAKDEDGNDLVPVQYTRAYNLDVGVHYITQLVLQAGEYDQDGNEITPPVFGNQALMILWLIEPQRSQQNGRIEARDAVQRALNSLAPIPENEETRLILEDTLDILNRTASSGVVYTVVDTIGWAGDPIDPGTQSVMEVLARLGSDHPAADGLGRAIEVINGNGAG